MNFRIRIICEKCLTNFRIFKIQVVPALCLFGNKAIRKMKCIHACPMNEIMYLVISIFLNFNFSPPKLNINGNNK